MTTALAPSVPTIEQFTSEDHLTWQKVRSQLFLRQDRIAFEGYRDCRERILGDCRLHVPEPAEVSTRLIAATGFSITPVDGIVPGGTFFESLRQRRFTAMTKIRRPDEWRFCSSPDWIHECVGHSTCLGDTRVARLYQLFGQVASASTSKSVLRQLGRLYWYTFEVGLVRESAEIKAFGAAILSSLAEMDNVGQANLRPFDPVEIVNTGFNYQDTQPTYFVADSTDELIAQLTSYLESMRTQS